MSSDLYSILEVVRAVCYALGVLASLYLCIASANMHDQALAGMLGAMAILYGAQLASIAVRYMGLGPVEARTLLTPAVLLHTVALLVLARRELLRTKRGQ